uniref:Uncharacterized protein LOC104246601 isoform X1 n=1 Tax=Nicotiana sylvestris TaxID=4096 RepID=A0A1U7YCB8_NICSY|nr:PREDICTED: uncharacterized protein LOC104246601 isoform X1 [Nicotiana sylvestris]
MLNNKQSVVVTSSHQKGVTKQVVDEDEEETLGRSKFENNDIEDGRKVKDKEEKEGKTKEDQVFDESYQRGTTKIPSQIADKESFHVPLGDQGYLLPNNNKILSVEYKGPIQNSKIASTVTQIEIEVADAGQNGTNDLLIFHEERMEILVKVNEITFTGVLKAMSVSLTIYGISFAVGVEYHRVVVDVSIAYRLDDHNTGHLRCAIGEEFDACGILCSSLKSFNKDFFDLGRMEFGYYDLFDVKLLVQCTVLWNQESLMLLVAKILQLVYYTVEFD